jgi:hypothetical protein
MTGQVALRGRTDTAQGGMGFSYRLFGSIHATASGGFRYAKVIERPRTRDAFASVGLSWSPGEMPLVF